MKYTAILLLLIIHSAVFSQVKPGMTVDEFKKQLPGILPDKIFYNEDLSFKEALQNFNGNWYFDFRSDTLIDLFYSLNMGRNPQEFTLRDFRFLVDDYTSVFGDAYHVVVYDTLIVANRSRNKETDTLLQYAWHANKTDFIMGIYFTGNYSVNKNPNEMVMQINAPPQSDYYIFKINCVKSTQLIENTGWNIYVGMTINELYKVLPEFFPNGIGITGQWSEEKTFINLKGNKTYDFENNILDYDVWNYYSPNGNKSEFDKCLKAYNNLKKEYISKYGQPALIEELPKSAFGNVAKNLKMYTVGKCVWNVNNVQIDLRFEKFSGKGDNYYILETKEELMKN